MVIVVSSRCSVILALASISHTVSSDLRDTRFREHDPENIGRGGVH